MTMYKVKYRVIMLREDEISAVDWKEAQKEVKENAKVKYGSNKIKFVGLPKKL